MAREYEADVKPMPEPLHERVLVLEKRLRELAEIIEELHDFKDRVSRELGL